MKLNLEYQKKLIAHGCGLYNNLIYTNSLEAILENYKKGYRRFEIDLHLTKEGNLISLHNVLGYNFLKQEDYNKISLKYLLTSISDFPFFVNNRFFIPEEKTVNKEYCKNQLTPITLGLLLLICLEYPDIEFILDTKYTSYKLYMKQFELIRTAFESVELELNQLTPQFYNIEMSQNVLKEFNFSNSIYTLYMERLNIKQLLKNMENYDNIKGVTISKKRLLKNLVLIKKLHELEKKCNVHTISNNKELDEFMEKKVDGIYTFVKTK